MCCAEEDMPVASACLCPAESVWPCGGHRLGSIVLEDRLPARSALLLSSWALKTPAEEVQGKLAVF